MSIRIPTTEEKILEETSYFYKQKALKSPSNYVSTRSVFFFLKLNGQARLREAYLEVTLTALEFHYHGENVKRAYGE